MAEEASGSSPDLGRETDAREKTRQGRLEYWLDNSRHLNFRRDASSFMNYPEGVCILAGIDPELSVSGEEGHGWYFLPGALASFLCPKYPCASCEKGKCNVYPRGFTDDYQSLLDAVERRLCRISSVGFDPLLRIRAAVEIAIERKLQIPWLRKEFISPRLESKLPKHALDRRPRFPGEIAGARGKAGDASAAVNDEAIILKEEVPRLFARFKDNDFKDQRTFATSAHVNWREVTRAIQKELDQADPGFPDEDTIYRKVLDLKK